LGQLRDVFSYLRRRLNVGTLTCQSYHGN